jgi:hypothetical protein
LQYEYCQLFAGAALHLFKTEGFRRRRQFH